MNLISTSLLVDQLGTAPSLSACKADVLPSITTGPYIELLPFINLSAVLMMPPVNSGWMVRS
jgi:hypothetical protein